MRTPWHARPPAQRCSSCVCARRGPPVRGRKPVACYGQANTTTTATATRSHFATPSVPSCPSLDSPPAHSSRLHLPAPLPLPGRPHHGWHCQRPHHHLHGHLRARGAWPGGPGIGKKGWGLGGGAGGGAAEGRLPTHCCASMLHEHEERLHVRRMKGGRGRGAGDWCVTRAAAVLSHTAALSGGCSPGSEDVHAWRSATRTGGGLD